MKTLYLECNMGAAGDMLSAALLELHPDPEAMIGKLNSLGIPGVRYKAQPMEKCGIRGTHLTVTVNGEEEQSADVHPHDREVHSHTHTHDHHGHDESDHGHDHGHGHHHVHRSLADIEAIVGKLELAEAVRKDILMVYRLIAEGESHAHGRPVEEIHFHEVGNMDAVADITAFCLLLHELSPEQVIVSPVRTGFGEVRCAHGILPVPAPATAWILRGVPIYAGDIRGELCTPTGAALLKHFASSYGTLPQMTVEKTGTGCGTKDFPQANCLRAMLGETPDNRDTVIELSCNLDDMTPEAAGFAMERLLEAGAVDVYVIPVTMKKSRPGLLLTCMCAERLRDRMIRQIFAHTTTLGIREYKCSRYTLQRSVETVHTPEGDIRYKKAEGYGTSRGKYEYDDLAALACRKDISLARAAAFTDGFRLPQK